MRVELNYWDSISAAVQSAIDSGRVGVPVFVRWTVLRAVDNRGVDRILSTMAGRVSSWFESEPHRLYTLGSPDTPSASLSLTFPDGPTALLVSGSGDHRNEVDLTLLGNQGAIYHHEFPTEAVVGLLEPQLDPSTDRLLEVIHASRQSGRPVSMGDLSSAHG